MTKAAEHSSEGCADAVHSSLAEAKDLITKSPSVKEAAKTLKMCVKTMPEYITETKTLSKDVMMAVAFSFAGKICISCFVLSLFLYR